MKRITSKSLIVSGVVTTLFIDVLFGFFMIGIGVVVAVIEEIRKTNEDRAKAEQLRKRRFDRFPGNDPIGDVCDDLDLKKIIEKDIDDVG